MSRVANLFIDPAGVRATYAWAINHDEEQDTGLSRTIDHTANTAGTGLVRQQGADDPITLTYAGTILDVAQHREFLAWVELSKHRTIFFRDFAGDEYEVLITAYKAPRTRVARNPRDPAHPWIWHYTLTMEVVTIRAGVYAQAGVTV